MFELSPLWRREIRSGLRRRSLVPLVVLIAGALRMASPFAGFDLPLLVQPRTPWRLTPEELALIIHLILTVAWTLERDRPMRWAIYLTPIRGRAIAWPKTLGPTLPTLLALLAWRCALLLRAPAATLEAWGGAVPSDTPPPGALVVAALAMGLCQPVLVAMLTAWARVSLRVRPVASLALCFLFVWGLLLFSAYLLQPRNMALPLLAGFTMVWLTVVLKWDWLMPLTCFACVIGIIYHFPLVIAAFGRVAFVIVIAGTVFGAIAALSSVDSNVSLLTMGLLVTVETRVLLGERAIFGGFGLEAMFGLLAGVLLIFALKWAVWARLRFRRKFLTARL